MVNFVYEDIPDHLKFKFVINSKDAETKVEYHRMIRWIRDVAGSDGAIFDYAGIGSSQPIKNQSFNPDKVLKDSPIFEIQVSYEEDNVEYNVNLVIFRANLYIIGFVIPDGNFQYKIKNCTIKGFERLQHDGRYSGCKNPSGPAVGPGAMIDALKVLHSTDKTIERKARAVETFFIHLAESARFKVIEIEIGSTIVLSRSTFPTTDSTYEYRTALDRSGEQKFQIHRNRHKRLPIHLSCVINKFKKLSKVWYFHILTNGVVNTISSSLTRDCHLRGIGSVRSALALLCNIKSEKLTMELQKKVVVTENRKRGRRGGVPGNVYTEELHEDVKKRVAKYKTDKLAFGETFEWDKESEDEQ